MARILNLIRKPWVIGSIVFYTPNFQDAKKSHDQISTEEAFAEPFGTASLEAGKKVDWVNTRYVQSGMARANASRW